MRSNKIKTKEAVTVSIDIELMKKARTDIENLSALFEKALRKELKMEVKK